MNKNVLLGIGALVIIGGIGAFFFLSSQNASNEQVTDFEDVIEETDTTMTEEEAMAANEEMIEKQDTVMEARDGSNDESSLADADTDTGAMMEEEKMMEDEGDTMMAGSGSYEDYSAAAFDAASDKKRVYFFHASWCPTCKAADEEITSNSDQIPEDVVVFKTDYDENTELKDQYGVTYQHTYVYVDENGEAIETWNGGSIDEIVDNTQS